MQEQETVEPKELVEDTKELVDVPDIFGELKKFHCMLNYSYIHAGDILDQILSTKAYTSLGHKSFASFLSDPEYGFPKSTAYLYIMVYRFYCLELGMTEEELMGIDITRLRDLVPVIRKYPDTKGEWIDKAKALGKIDFINEIRNSKKLPDLDFMPPMPDEEEVLVVTSTYTELCKAAPCAICGKRPVDFHHFPRTRGAGADDDKVIPLCRSCHIEFHQHPKEMLWTYREKIFDWFYKIMFGLLGIKETK